MLHRAYRLYRVNISLLFGGGFIIFVYLLHLYDNSIDRDFVVRYVAPGQCRGRVGRVVLCPRQFPNSCGCLVRRSGLCSRDLWCYFWVEYQLRDQHDGCFLQQILVR